jgi:hypothetical protein
MCKQSQGSGGGGGGEGSRTDGTTGGIQAPHISSLSPSSGKQGEGYDVTIKGSSFDNSVMVDFGSGITVSNRMVTNAQEIKVHIAIGNQATIGQRDVVLSNSAGRAVEKFTIVKANAPVITSIAPSSGRQSSELEVVIKGRYFEGSVDVSFGDNITVSNKRIISSNEIRVHIAINNQAAIGQRDVVLSNSAGRAVKKFTVLKANVSVITSIAPSSGRQGSELEVVIKGRYFEGSVDVSFGDNIAVSNKRIISSNEIRVHIAIGSGASIGQRDIYVSTQSGRAVKKFNVVRYPPTKYR